MPQRPSGRERPEVDEQLEKRERQTQRKEGVSIRHMVHKPSLLLPRRTDGPVGCPQVVLPVAVTVA